MRRASRTNLYLAATLIGKNTHLPVTVRNLSATGALVRARAIIGEIGPICLVRGSLRAPASVAWKDGPNGGLHFDAPINLGEWAPITLRDGQRQVDRMVAQCRGETAPFLPGSAAQLGPEEPRVNLVARIAEELAFAARRLEHLGGTLAEDPVLIRRHGDGLQDLDITAQILGHLSRLLRSEAPDALLDVLGMEDLRRRLERRSLAR